MTLVKEFFKLMQGEFEMIMMGELNYFLMQLKEGTFVSQTNYCQELIKRFDMTKSNVIDTPMPTAVNLYRDEHGKPVDVKRYRGMIGSLLYLTASCPDIMFSVCMCARYESCPKESHLKAV